MDKETLSHYGWIVVLVLILSVMIALATPFGNFLATGFKSTYASFVYTAEKGTNSITKDIPTPPDQLKDKHSMKYYSSLKLAVDDINANTHHTDETLADVEKYEDAIAAVYIDDNNIPTAILLKDHSERTITVKRTQNISLGGHIVYFDTPTDITGFHCVNENEKIQVFIDGRLYGSKVLMNTERACVVYASDNSTVTVKKGYYEVNTLGECRGIFIDSDADNLIVDGITMYTSTQGQPVNDRDRGVAYCISSLNTFTVSNSVLHADSTYETTEDDYITLSSAIVHAGEKTGFVYSCNAIATHSAIEPTGPIYIDGGTYESLGHGGVYFSNAANNDMVTHYCKNATLRNCEYKGKLELYIPPENVEDGWNYSGFYIGGYTNKDNISVYMDNCNIHGDVQPFVLRSTHGEKNINLYISNSTINKDYTYGCRIDSQSHSLFVGKGCNITADDLESLVEPNPQNRLFLTDEVYKF